MSPIRPTSPAGTRVKARARAVSAGRKPPSLYVFGWPGFLGGADTKLAHLLRLLHRHYRITVIPNDAERLAEEIWTRFLDRLGIAYSTLRALPRKLEGFGLALCNERFFTDGIAKRVRARGLQIVWSSEMMWHHRGEAEAAKAGLIDQVLYVSEFQRRALSRAYHRIPGLITGNYIDPKLFPFKERRHSTFAIGRLSRPDPAKYPEDFPVFYECLGLPDTRFRVMAWSDDLRRKYGWHRFDGRWDLLEGLAEPQVRFLHSLDLFVYPLGHTFRESWGRSTVEAMLTGAIPLVPCGHHFENLLVQGESGFLCADFREYQEHAQRLCLDFEFRRRVSRQCRTHAEQELCNASQHLKMWQEVFQ